MRGVRARLALFSIAAAVLPALVVAGAGAGILLAAFPRFLQAEAHSELESRALAFAAALEGARNESRALASALAEARIAAGAAGGGDEALLDRLARSPRTDLRRFAETHFRRVLRVALLGPGGTARAAVASSYGRSEVIRARDLRGAELAGAALPAGAWRELLLSGSAVLPGWTAGNVPFLRCAARLETPADGEEMAVALDVRTATLLEAGGRNPGGSPRLLLVAGDGRLVAHPNAGAVGRPLARVHPAAAATLGKAGAWIEEDGERLLLAATALAGLPPDWRLVRILEVEPLLAGWSHALRTGLAVAAVAGALAAAAAWRMALPFARGVEQLTAQARRLGGGGLEARAPRGLPAELGELAAAFDRMAADLRAALAAAAERARLEERDRARAELLGNVSHDLRTPLTALRWGVDNLLDGVAGELPEKARRTLEDLHASAAHLQGLVEDLLALARIEEGGLELDREELELEELAREAVALLRAGLHEKEQQVRIRGRARVRGDRQRLRRVLVNLLENASRHSPRGGEIRVEAGTDGQHACCAVHDTGPGIPEEQREAVFARHRSGGAGLGIGLHLARALARAHGGDLVAREAPGGGARLVLTLPRAEP